MKKSRGRNAVKRKDLVPLYTTYPLTMYEKRDKTNGELIPETVEENAELARYFSIENKK